MCKKCTLKSKVTASELRSELKNFYGTANWYRHPLMKRLLYTDGIKYVAETAGAYWLLDMIALEFVHRMSDGFANIKLAVTGSSALITMTDGNDKVLAGKGISYTDFPEGAWSFFIVDDGEHWVLMLPSEY